MQPIICKTTLLNPFSCEGNRFWQKVYTKSCRGGGVKTRQIYRALFALGKMCLPRARGRAVVTLDGVPRTFVYPLFNTQYHALYDPLYAYGYEAETAALIRLLLPGADHFMDVGSNWGYFTLFARACGYAGRISAFEPQTDVYREMQDILKQVGLLHEDTMLYNKAVARRHGRVDLVSPDGMHSGTAGVRPGHAIEAVPLDDYAGTEPGLIKIDVEGYEGEVLAGAGAVLADCRPYIIFESWRDSGQVEQTLQPFRMLTESDYVFYQPALLKDTRAGSLPLVYGEYWDLEPEMNLALYPFEMDRRFLLRRQFNVLACPAEKSGETLQARLQNE